MRGIRRAPDAQMSWTPPWLVGLVCWAGSVGVAHAERALTLDEALAQARAHNRDLRVARARLEAAEAGVAEARAALLPTAAAQGRYTHNYKEVSFDFSMLVPSGPAAPPPITIQPLNQLDASIAASVPLLSPPAMEGLVAARATLRGNEAGYEVTEATVLAGVARAFFAAAGTDELVRARADAVRVADETFRFAKARVGSDLANPVDVTRAETSLVRAQQDLAQAETTRAQAYRSLATLIDVHDELHVTPPVLPADTPVDAGELAKDALAVRPELAADREAIAAAHANAAAQAWKWAPTLSAFGNAHVANYASFSGDKYSWAVGLQLDWVLYDGGFRDAQRAIYNAQAVEIQAQLDLEADTISDEVKNAADDLATKRKAVTAAERAVALATESLRIVRAQYEAGTSSQLDLLAAQDSLVIAQVGVAQAHFDLSLADVELRRASGTFPGRGR